MAEILFLVREKKLKPVRLSWICDFVRVRPALELNSFVIRTHSALLNPLSEQLGWSLSTSRNVFLSAGVQLAAGGFFDPSVAIIYTSNLNE
jgi:hypothetical protein